MAFLHPYATVRIAGVTGLGIFAVGPIKKGEIVTDTRGVTRPYSPEEATALPPELQGYLYGGENGELLGPKDFADLHPCWRVNHSCLPNLGSAPNFDQLVAIRDIQAGEELTFDYAMTDCGDEEMECKCGASCCRGVIRGADWRLAVLQWRYEGYFQPNVQRLIEEMHESASSP